MAINWDEIQKVISPLKDYEDLCQRFKKSFGFPFVYTKFNYSMPQLSEYTDKLLLGDARNRYTGYHAMLEKILSQLGQTSIKNVFELSERTSTPGNLEIFTSESGLPATDICFVLKYLVYWFIPTEKYLSGLVRDDPEILKPIKILRELNIRTNLEILDKGITISGRKSLVVASGLPEAVVSELVNWADFSRLPWASKATISNIIGAGYGSLTALANANPDQLYTDFFNYGKKIGKNLKLGNEIENSYRIAKIVPVLLESDLPTIQ